MCKETRNTDPNSPQLFDCNYVYITVGDENGGLSSEDLLGLLEPIPRVDSHPPLPVLSEQEKREMVSVVREVSTILVEHDPVCLDFGNNKNEYDPEADSLLAMLQGGLAEDQVADALVEVINYYFDRDYSLHVRDRKWMTMAQRIWASWTAYQEGRSTADK